MNSSPIVIRKVSRSLQLFCAGLLSLVMAGCVSSAADRLIIADSAVALSRQSTTVGEDGTLTVRLRGTAGSSYAWRLVDAAAPNDMLALEHRVTEHDAKGNHLRAGGATWDIFTFAAHRSGNARLRFVYDRAWETNTPPLKEFALDVEVTPEPE